MLTRKSETQAGFRTRVENEWIVECEGTQKEAAEAVQQLLVQHPKITAILCHRPVIALVAKMKSPDLLPEKVVLAPTLIIRGSA